MTEPQSDGQTHAEAPGSAQVAVRVADDDQRQKEPASSAPKPETKVPDRGGVWRRLLARLSHSPDYDELGEGQVTFSDLVRAHQAWEQELYRREHRPVKGEPDTTRDKQFRDKWRDFERRYGKIVDAYWSVRDASAVALTIRHKRRRFRPDPELIPRFHRATDWATRDEREIAEALDDCETLAVRTEEILRGASELIALRRINAVASHILGFVDRERGRRPAPSDEALEPATTDPDRTRFVARQQKELKNIETFYNKAGNWQARHVFFVGMALGLLWLGVLTAVAVALTWRIDIIDDSKAHWGDIQLLIISVMAGAFGALLSVLTRMASLTGKFDIDHEIGRKNVRWIGVYRPFVGGIFGMATFLLIASGILQTETPGAGAGAGEDFAYYGILALFSGFFERFTKLTGGVPTGLEGEGKGKGKSKGKT